MKSIAKNEITQPSGRKVLVSTAELPEGIYETMAILADGDELEQIRTTTRVDALQAHSELVPAFPGSLCQACTQWQIGAGMAISALTLARRSAKRFSTSS
jgi:hypothetical protein